MGWLKLDDGFFLHPKALAAGRDARDVYLTALCWSNQQQTDGVIPAHALALIGGLAGVADSDQAASRLCAVGLWEPHVDGWHIHDFLAYQQSKEERDEWRERERDRKQKAREARKRAQVPENVRAESARIPTGVPRVVREMSALEKRSEQKRSGGGVSSGLYHQECDSDVTEATTTTTSSEITEAMELVAEALTAEKPRDDPASYHARIIANGDDHRRKLATLAQPGDSAATLAERYLATRKRGTAPKAAPRCGICHQPPHPDGICPTLGAA
jgi:hypothetical protein